ncbi:MAG: NUDIX hydrolase [Gemmatimonas sp.]
MTSPRPSLPPARTPPAPDGSDTATVGLAAVVVAVSEDEPKVLAIRGDGEDALPSGPLEPQHRTLEAGLRAWVEKQTSQKLGYVEQLYTFGDRNRQPDSVARPLSIGYLALVREARPAGSRDAEWRDWYRYFPWEDWRGGRPAIVADIEQALSRWAAAATGAEERRLRQARAQLSFGYGGAPWNDERVLERYELLYEVGVVPEAHRDGAKVWATPSEVIAGAEAMVADHRRILATAVARLRGKIKYRPVVFEVMPPEFTLSKLQRTVEALAGLRLHAPNFRRLVETQGLVEETGAVSSGTGGRPARLVRFRREVLIERPAPGVRLPVSRRI